MGLFGFGKKRKQDADNPTIEKNSLQLNPYPVHPDIQDLLWIADGPHRNFFPKKRQSESYTYHGITISFGTMGPDEPSLISLKFPIADLHDFSNIERPPYYPSYEGLSPEQRRIYWKLLENPYNSDIDVGYAFILYYGLERHLFEGDFYRSFQVILKMRDSIKNKSFQQYSSKALVLSCLVRQEADYAARFLSSIDKDYEMQVDLNIFTLCKLGLHLPLYPKEIMVLHKKFYFENNRYIKSQPDKFLQFLTEIIIETYGVTEIDIRQFFDMDYLHRIKPITTLMYANYALTDSVLSIPNFIEYKNYYTPIRSFLAEAHERVKSNLHGRNTNPSKKNAQKTNASTQPIQEVVFPIDRSFKSKGAYKIQLACRQRAKDDILSLNHYLEQAARRCPVFPKVNIREKEINFDPRSEYINDFCNVENCPSTPSGKPAKYSQCLHFYTKYMDLQSTNTDGIFGDIFYLQNTTIGKVRIICWKKGKCFAINCTVKYGELQVSAIDLHTEIGIEKLFRL